MKNKVNAFKGSEDITVKDCEELYEHEGYAAICNDGQLDGFVREEHFYRQKDRLKFIWPNNG